MKKKIAIDMDQVIADFYTKLWTTHNELFEDQMTYEQFSQGTALDLAPEKLKPLFEKMNEPSYFRDLPLLDEDAVKVVEKLQEHYDIFIATAAMDVPGSFQAKFEWLQQYFPFIPKRNIVFCGDKSIIHADYLIDDSVRQLTAFTGEGILYSMPYNVHATNFKRVANWKEIEQFFMKELQIR